jgi:hypothetical protein
MAKEKDSSVTMRVRVGDAEIEVTGPSSFVEKKIAEFLKGPPKKAQAQSPSAAPSVASEPVMGKPKSPAQFFKQCNPQSANDRALLGGYFLEKFRQVQNFTAAEVRDIVREAKWPPPPNVNDSINQNIRKGYLMTAGDREGKIAFVVTSDGEAAVEEMAKSKE